MNGARFDEETSNGDPPATVSKLLRTWLRVLLGELVDARD
jgi:hypothetical protein